MKKNYKYVIWKGQKCYDKSGICYSMTVKFFHGGIPGMSRTIRSSNHDHSVVEIYDNKDNRDMTERPQGKGWCWDPQKEEWFRIRKLTARECYRLMGVDDDTITKIQTARFKGKTDELIGYVENGVEPTYTVEKVGKKKTTIIEKKGTPISESQQYKQAGNSIVVDCLDGIFENLFYPKN